MAGPIEVAGLAAVEGVADMVHSNQHGAAQRAPHSRRIKPATVLWLKTLEEQGIAPAQHVFDHFPHVLDRIAAVWGNVRAMDELMANDLLIDNRGNRQGFPFKVLLEIQALHHAHQTRYTMSSSSPGGWDSFHLRRNS